jgi:integrase
MEFGDWYLYWFKNYRAEGLRKASIEKYMLIYRRYVKYGFAKLEIEKIQRSDIQKFVHEFGKTHAKETVKRVADDIRASLDDAMIDNLIPGSPYVHIELFYTEKAMTAQQKKAKRDKKKWLEIDEYQRLKNFLVLWLAHYLDSDATSLRKDGRSYDNEMPVQFYVMVIYFALLSGCRLSEILGLTIDDINFETGIISINKTWDYKYYNEFADTKNISSLRDIKIPDELLKETKRWIEWRKQYNTFDEKRPLFVAKYRNFIDSTLNQILTRLLKLCAIERISFHKLRHTHASILIAQGISLQVVAKRLGHSDTQMIQRIYGHLLKSVDESETEKILGLL